MYRLRASALFLAFLAIGCDRASSEPASDTKARERPARKSVDTQAIIDWIQTSQRDGVQNRNPKAFMKIWADDVKMITARSEKPGPYDFTFDHGRLKKAAYARAKGKADAELTLRYESETAEVVDDGVVIRWILHVDWKMGASKGVDTTREVFRVRRTDAGWRVYENRFWPVSSRTDRGTTSYDDAFFAARDADVAALGTHAPLIDRAHALEAAFRLGEAHAATKVLTKQSPDRADAWAHRARIASRVRDIEDCFLAYKRLQELDPKAHVPGWVKAHW